MECYTVSLTPPRAADNNKNKPAQWLRSSNDRRAPRAAEITPHPAFFICFQLSTSPCKQTHYTELKSRQSLIQSTESFTRNESSTKTFSQSSQVSVAMWVLSRTLSNTDDGLLYLDQLQVVQQFFIASVYNSLVDLKAWTRNSCCDCLSSGWLLPV